MNIFYDHTIFEQVYGGVSRYFCEIIRRLAGYEGIDINLFMGLFLNRYSLNDIKKSCRAFWGYPVPSLPHTISLRRAINRESWKIFTQIYDDGKQESIYHPTYYNYAGLHASKVVFTVYDFTHERYSSLFPSDDDTSALKAKAFDRADTLICISESTKKDLLELYNIKPSSKVKVIYLGFNDLAKQPEDLNILPDRPYFLYVGTRRGYKNFGCLINAFASEHALQNDFVIVCCGGSPFSDEEKDFFAGLNIQNKIFYRSGSDSILSSLYKNAVAFVYPSLYEGFGIPLLEAMNCGCPVIASNTSSIPEVVGSAALLFDPNSPEELGDLLTDMVSQDTLRKKMITLGQERSQMFSWEKCAKETLAFYKEII